jgi:hypothetical protein
MEIKKIHQGGSPIPHKEKMEADRSGGRSFLALLETSTEKLNKADPAGTNLFPGPISSLPPLSALREVKEDAGSISTQGVLATERALGILETYQRALSDAEVPLEKIEPLIQFLSQGLDRLILLSEELPSSHPLKSILTDAGIISAVEIEKFHRGDYSN